MTDKSIYENNPLHGLSLENLLNQIVEHYGFEILNAYLNINCFKKNASIESSVKFLKKTDWAREKVESFYLYKFKSLPKATGAQFNLPPRDRIIPPTHTPGAPAELSLEDAERMQANKAKMAADFNRGERSKKYNTPKTNTYKDSNHNYDDRKKDGPSKSSSDNPWGNWGK